MSVSKAKPKKIKFNASMPFPNVPPFSEIFFERVPVLHGFQIAIANYLHAERQRKEKNPWGGFLWRRGVRRLTSFNAVECGVFTGSSLVACAKYASESGIPLKMIGLDTFAGLPPLSEQDKLLAPEDAVYRSQTLFTETSRAGVQALVDAAGLTDQVELMEGLFSQSLPLLEERKYHYVNIDCDLFEPHIECLEYFYPRMVRGGVIFFDDYNSVNYPMAGKAIDQFFRDKPEKLAQLRYGDDAPNRTKAYIVKY
ncbi:TylF/MycF family methyltransferase [Pseudomonas vlassakiae]|uniref:TylF/MycF family methyltransferase n=2 Tax=Pseudomonas vlassakiae TaxID=485888 RepID=A0ABS6R0K5_9PSED|nr:TylF/MycF/NovP-related O-methyltransferase [Pseudomonas vlassakiae]MBV4539614.1 TylF/MycF family methyltransferase [Pseudomonas vlassakiae]MCU0126406.1 TylF/MycF family methyltransferase [Pseudomonas vlassakiae]